LEGPYRLIRHADYPGCIACVLFSGLAPGSWWAPAPVALILALFVRRVSMVDRFLQRGLDGYREYADRVRYRLAPASGSSQGLAPFHREETCERLLPLRW
jgi:protein-S-isoprenylcysteine O-methyltransferase Ste14